MKYALADLGGRTRRAPPLTARNFLNFMQFFGKFDNFVCWRPPPGRLVPPSTGNPGSAPDMECPYPSEFREYFLFLGKIMHGLFGLFSKKIKKNN